MGLITHNNDVDITGYLSVSGNLSAGVDDLYVDTSTNMVGIGTAFPTSKLTVVGDIFCYDNIYADNIYTDNVYGNNIVYNTGDQTISGVKSFLELKSLKTPVNIDDVVNRDYSNKNLVLVKDLTLQNHVFLDLGFPTGSPETGFKKISWILRQSSGNSYTVNYENVDWLTSSPTNPTETTPIFLETYPQSATGTKSYGIFLNPVADLEKIKSNIVYTTGDQVISGYKKFEEDVYIRNLYVTGSETIVSSTNTNVSSNYLLLNVTGGATDGGVFFVTGSGLTGVNDSGAIIGFDDFENFKFGIGSRSQDLNSLETIASTKFVNDSISGLSGFVFDIASTDYSLPNTLVRRSSLGYASFSFISADETDYSSPNTTQYQYGKITKYYGGSESPDSYSYAFPSKSGEIALDTTAVMLTGNQTISGVKTFANDLNISGTLSVNNSYFDGQSWIAPSGGVVGMGGYYTNNISVSDDNIYIDAFSGSINISGLTNFKSRPTVNTTGVLLSGEAVTQAYATGISGELQTQITNLNNATGDYVLTGQTGQFYANSNPSGFVVNSGGVASITRLTQSQYNSLTPNPTTLYIIIG